MGTVHGKYADHSVAGVALEDYMRSFALEVTPDTVDATTASKEAKVYAEGLYGFSMTGEYVYDNAAGASDPTLYDALLTGHVVVNVVPGGGSASATNPEYEGNGIVTEYVVTIPHDNICTCKATFTGTGSLSRNIT